MSYRSVIAVASCAVSLLLVSAPSAGAAPPGVSCGRNLGAPQIAAAVRSLSPAFADRDVAWNATPYDGNFDPCATLSTALVTIDGATGSSPEHALFFHHGEYLGTATAAPRAFTSLDDAQTSDGTVVLRYKDGRNVCTACEGPIDVVRYQWQGDHVEMLDPAPPGPN